MRNNNKKYRNTEKLKVIYTNINGIRSKISKLETVLTLTTPHVICLTETETETPPNIEGYTWHHKPRKNRKGGGVAILTRNDLRTDKVDDDLEETQAEIIWTEVKQGKKVYSFGVYYGKQETEDLNIVQTEFSEIASHINKLRLKGGVIMTGDFNAKLKIDTPEAKQNMSRNGRLLHDMIKTTNLKTASIDNTKKGIWTRVNRHNESERSIIDYILTDEDTQKGITFLEIDEEGKIRMDGRKESDHNTIYMELELEHEKPTQERITKWKINEKSDWEAYNEYINGKLKETGSYDYNTLNETIQEALQKTIGTKEIRTGQYKERHPKHVREAIRSKNKAKKELKEHTKSKEQVKKDDGLNEKIKKYVKAQEKAVMIIEAHQRKRIRHITERIAKEGGVNSNLFWKLNRQQKGKTQNKYDICNSEGKVIENPEHAREAVAKYFEDLYKPWPPSNQEITNQIYENNKAVERSNKKIEPITLKEIKTQKKRIKNKKATGPDNIPNEIITKANETTLKVYMKSINRILTGEEPIPKEWKEGMIKTIYKGKGKKGMMINERGITMSSNMGKLAERIIADRILEQINMTDNQAGGKKRISTSDHIIVIKNIIKHNRRKRKPTYITLLDVTKAYDKAWLEGIMYALQKSGLREAEWKITKELSNNLTARINTIHGQTREINIQDSIRQGGVLSVIQYANLIDEIAKDLKGHNLGCYQTDNSEEIPCLLWMDDVALLTTDKEKMQKMLDRVQEIAEKYRIHFGTEKSNIMIIGKKDTDPGLKLMNQEIKPTTKYKYLGYTLNDKNNNSDHIQNCRSKAEMAYQTLLSIMGNKNFRQIEMDTAWKLVKTTIIPIITYAGESIDMNKKEIQEINRILDNILKRLLMVPQSTPREPLYLETGIMDIETTINRNRIMMLNRISKTDSILLKTNTDDHEKTQWRKSTDDIIKRYRLDPETIISQKKSRIKKIVNEAVRKQFRTEMIQKALEKTKSKHFLYTTDGLTQTQNKNRYIYKLTRMESSAIFRARTKMIDVKMNYKGKYSDTTCRHCKKHPETQEHILQECEVLHEQEKSKTREEDLRMTSQLLLRETAKKIISTMTKHLESI